VRQTDQETTEENRGRRAWPVSKSAGRATGVELRAHDLTPSLPSVTRCTSAVYCKSEPCRSSRVDGGHEISRHGALVRLPCRGSGDTQTSWRKPRWPS
jgi:hypothetical protein